MNEDVETQYSLRVFLQQYQALIEQYMVSYSSSNWSHGIDPKRPLNQPISLTPKTFLAKVKDQITTINFNTPSVGGYYDFDMARRAFWLIDDTLRLVRYYMSSDVNPIITKSEYDLLKEIENHCLQGYERFFQPRHKGIFMRSALDTLKLRPAVLRSVSAIIQWSSNQ